MTTPPTTTAGPVVALTSDGLRIQQLLVTDPDVLAGAQRHLNTVQPPSNGQRDADAQAAALARYTTSALGVGARALAVVESSLDLAALDQSVTRLGDTVETSTQRALAQLAEAVTAAADPHHGAIPRSVETSLGRLTEQVSALVAGHDAPVRAAVTESVRAVTEQTLAEVQRAIGAQADAVRRVLATDAPGSPLHDLKTGLVHGLNESHRRLSAQLSDLRTALEVDKTKTAAAARAPQHGLDTEAATLAVLEQVAHTAGDQLDSTGTVPGLIPRCLKGDGVITFTPPPGHSTPPARVVVEVKDRERPQSLAAWTSQLTEARKNRQAVAALAVVKSTDQMPGQRRLHVLDPTTYLLAYDPSTDDQDLLVAAYQLLRAHTWTTALAVGQRAELDIPAVRGSIADLTTALTAFDGLTRHHNAARRSIEQADKAAGALRADLHARVAATRVLLTGHPRDPAAPTAEATTAGRAAAEEGTAA